MKYFLPIALAVCAFVGLSASAEENTPDSNKLMRGFPPSTEHRVTSENMMEVPYIMWGLRNVRELQPTRDIYRGDGPATTIVKSPIDLDALSFSLSQGRKTSLSNWLDYSATHSFIVLHKGRIVFERYLNGMAPHDRHNMFSVTKSYVGTLVLILIDQGLINADEKISVYIPELKESAFGDATVQQVLDMTVSIQFSEDYLNPDADVWRYGSIFGLGPQSARKDDSIYEFLPVLKKNTHAHGEGFHYVSPKTEVLGWLLNKVTGKHVSALLSEYFWQPMGMDRDGYIWIDKAGGELAAAGLNTTARDAARFGQMILQEGRYNGKQIIPAAVAKKIIAPGDREVFQRFYDDPWYRDIGHSYHDQWWTFNNAHKAVSGIGIHGQFIYIDPVADMVVVKQSAHHEAEGDANEVDGPMIWQQIAEHLMTLDPPEVE